jgi:hypothetical protein
MGVFSDDKLEQLDWMTQMTETIDSDLNTVLAQLPDRLEITPSMIVSQSGNYSLNLSLTGLVRRLVENVDGGRTVSWEEERIISKCFHFEGSEAIELDLKNNTLSGQLALVKTVKTLSDEDLQPLMGSRGIDMLSRISRDAPVERLNEILDLLGGCSETIKNRSTRKKNEQIIARLRQIFATNEWRIRDMNLANKVSFWIKEYAIDGNLAAFTNLCKLKVMTHNNMPIYSVKEEV